MSLECGECERDLRGGHDRSCSRYKTPKKRVLLHHKDAFCETIGDRFQVVRPLKYGHVEVLGGPNRTRRGAWAEAARNIEQLS